MLAAVILIYLCPIVQVSDVSESKLAVEGHSVVVDQQSASVPTASAQYEPVSKDGTTNSIETNAKAALAETGATKAALPQSVPGSDSSDLRNGAQNEASMGGRWMGLLHQVLSIQITQSLIIPSSITVYCLSICI